MTGQSITNGGVQYVPQLAVQYVYLDFDGELTSYNGEILTVDGVEVIDSKLTAGRIANIVAKLNDKYASQNVIFVTERPEGVEYSTILIGKTSAFDQYGTFAGLAENIDTGNAKKTDKAFVMLDSTSSDEAIISTIDHETSHLLGTLNHGGEGLNEYAETFGLITLMSGQSCILESGDSAKHVAIYDGELHVRNGGYASMVYVYSSGSIYVSSGGSIKSCDFDFPEYAVLHILNGGKVRNLGASTNLVVYVSSGGLLERFTWFGDGTYYFYSGCEVYDYDDSTRHVISGGTASYFSVVAGDRLYLSGGAKDLITVRVDSIKINNYVDVLHMSGGIANHIAISSGEVHVSSGGVAVNADIKQSNGFMYVYSQGFAQSVTMSAGRLTLSNGASAQDTVMSGGSFYVENGASAQDTVMSGGSFFVENGASAQDTVMSGGCFYVKNGSIATNNVLSGGAMYVSSGASAKQTVLQNTAFLYVDSKAKVNDVTVGYGCKIFVSGGGTATAVKENGGFVEICEGANVSFMPNTFENLVFANKSATLHSGTVGKYLTVNSSGNLYIYDGGVGSDLTVNSSGTLYISSGGSGADLTVNSGANVHIYGVGSNLTVNKSGYLYVYSGGSVFNANLMQGFAKQNVFVYDGGYASCVNVNHGVDFTVYGFAEDVTLSGVGDVSGDYSDLNVSSGGRVQKVITSDGGNITVFGDGQIKDLTIKGGKVAVLGFGIISNVHFESAGSLSVYSGGVIDSAVFTGNIQSDHAFVDNGGTIKHLSLENGADLKLNGTAEDVKISGNQENGDISELFVGTQGRVSDLHIAFAGTVNINSNGSAGVVTVSHGGILNVSRGGIANSVVVNSNGTVNILQSGIASNFTVQSGGKVNVATNGTIDNMRVCSGGELTLGANVSISQLTLEGGCGLGAVYFSEKQVLNSEQDGRLKIAEQVFFIDNTLQVMDGGEVNGLSVLQGGVLNIQAGGTALNVIENGGFVDIADGATVTFASNAFNDLALANNSASLHSNTSAMETFIGSNGMLVIYDGGMASGVEVSASGALLVSSGGTALNIIENGGFVDVKDGTDVSFAENTINDLTLDRTSATLHSNTVASNTVITDGLLHVYDGGTANATTVSQGSIVIHSGGTANATTVSQGSMVIHNGGTASSATVMAQGGIFISSGGTALNIVENGGFVDIEDGAMVSFVENKFADAVLANNSATLHSGTTAENLSINAGGSAIVFDGGSAISATVSNNGMLTVFSGGYVNSTTIDSGGSMLLVDKALAENTVVSSGGVIHLSSGGVMNSTTIISAGVAHISSGGIFNNVSMGQNAVLNISSGGILRGTVNADFWAVINAEEGAIVDFDLRERTAENDYIYSDISVISGTPTYTITVAENQASGIYSLARGSFLAITLSVGNGTENFGLLTIDDEPLKTEKYTFSLLQTVAGELRLKVVAVPLVMIYNNANLVSSGLEVNNVTLAAGGNNSMYVSKGGIANNTTVNKGGSMFIYSGGSAAVIRENGGYIECSDGANVSFIANEFSDLTLNKESATLHSGTTAVGTTISEDGKMYIYSGGSAIETTIYDGGRMYVYSGAAADNVFIDDMGYLYISNGGFSENSFVNDGGRMYIARGGTAVDTMVENGARLYISSGAIISGSLQINSDATVSAYRGAIIDFSIADRSSMDDYLINDLALVKGSPTYTITVSASQATGTYKLAQGAENFTGSITIGDGTVDYGTIMVNGDDFVRNGVIYSLDKVDGNLTFTVTKQPVASNLQGNVNGVSWNGSCDAYSVIYSNDNFAAGLQVNTTTNSVDTYGMPKGTYQWKVAADGEEYIGNDIVSDNTTAAQKLISDADGNMDLFFGKANGTWGIAYAAQNAETGEVVALNGKNRIQDVFIGSTDANVIVLTDDANGDALFIDDMYSAFGNQARLSQIDEIRAGAGNDIIDLTSDKYAFAGDGVTIYGGAGDDTIWANSGNDVLIGGTGNDSLFGGGGNDTFIFGDNWGKDIVDQLASGKVTLHFENGSLANWNAATGVYSDGVNSVTVTGTTDITLKFGEDASLPAGVFTDAVNEKIFEDKNNAMLA